MKIAIVYDWLDKWGGVERLLLTLHEAFPEADWYSSYVDRESAPWTKDLKIHTTFIQKLPPFIKKNRILSLPFYPYAFESLNLSQYDVVISVTSSFAKGIITKPGTTHICYMLTPTRYLWGMTDVYLQGLKRIIASPFIERLRKWDYIAAQRPDSIISLSKAVAYRIETYYKRMCDVLYPPFDTEYWKKIKENIKKPSSLPPDDKEYYLVVSRLEPYKRVDLPIQLCNRLKKNLIVVGRGTEESKLRSIASPHITFISNLTDEELGYLYSHAKVLIIPQEEDFGYVSLEAQFFGCPVVAYAQGGVSETLFPGGTNTVFKDQNEVSLQEALASHEVLAYNVKHRISPDRNFFEQFSSKNFIEGLKRYIIR